MAARSRQSLRNLSAQVISYPLFVFSLACLTCGTLSAQPRHPKTWLHPKSWRSTLQNTQRPQGLRKNDVTALSKVLQIIPVIDPKRDIPFTSAYPQQALSLDLSHREGELHFFTGNPRRIFLFKKLPIPPKEREGFSGDSSLARYLSTSLTLTVMRIPRIQG
jgi:hypothetical protein